MKILNKCEICGGKKFLNLGTQWDKNLSIKKYFKIQKCKNCGIVFLNPQPSFVELKEHYPKNEYYSLRGIDKGLKSKIRMFFYNLYYKENKNYFFKALFSPLKFYFRRTKIIKNGKLLDIGSGSGQFLYEMKRLGMKIYGVEPGEFDKKEKLNIINSDLIGAKYPSNFFDVITMNHVLEHIPNPKETLMEVYRILKVGGEFIIAVPNTRSLAYYMFSKNWYQLDVPRHLFNYSDILLKEILKKIGFKNIRITYNSTPSQFVVSLSYLLGLRLNSKIIKVFLNILFLPLTYFVNFLKIGDQIEITCTK